MIKEIYIFLKMCTAANFFQTAVLLVLRPSKGSLFPSQGAEKDNRNGS